MDAQCLFCKISRGEFNTEFLYKSPTRVAFRALHPKAPTHVLFVPLAHYATFNDIPASESALMGEITVAIQNVAKAEGVDQTGYRVITNVNRHGGQEVYHLHVHLLGGRQLGSMG
jgi:histidine triad (HIT) family protein